MIRFIVCEDNKQFLEKVNLSITKAMINYNFDYKVNKFTEYNEELKGIINNPKELKIYILDIELPKISGLEIASEIRRIDTESVILFLTAYDEWRNDIFYSRLLALDYISKDQIWSYRFEDTIKHTIEVINSKRVLSFEFNCNSYRVPFKQIKYIEKVQDHQKCIIHTDDGEEYQICANISELKTRLGPGFYQTHKSCIVNVEKIKYVDYNEGMITFFNNESIYLLSTRNKKGLKEYVANYECVC